MVLRANPVTLETACYTTYRCDRPKLIADAVENVDIADEGRPRSGYIEHSAP
jgi:hypothetical protein